MSKKQNKLFDELTIADDFMFGVVMRNPELCKPLLEMLLGIRIERIEYQETQKIIDLTADSKSVRLDVYVEDEKHSVYDIEMQTSSKRNLPKRSRYYQGMIDLNLIDKGADYEELNKSFVIFICTFDLFGEGRHIYTFENRCTQNTGLLLNDGAIKVFVNTKGKGGDEKWRRDYMTLYMREREIFKEAREEGYAEGRERGLEDGLKQGLEDGMERGLENGRRQGEERLARLIGHLSADGRDGDIEKACTDSDYRNKLYEEYGLQI